MLWIFLFRIILRASEQYVSVFRGQINIMQRAATGPSTESKENPSFFPLLEEMSSTNRCVCFNMNIDTTDTLRTFQSLDNHSHMEPGKATAYT